MEFKHYIGVDVSKKTLDFTLLKEGEFLLHEQVNNTTNEIRIWLKKVMVEHRAGGKRTLFCVENTGTYTSILLQELVRRKVALWVESPLQIKLSLGLQRGKSDKIDSRRIAQYAYTYRKTCRIWSQPRPVIEHLRRLRSLRERLMNASQLLKDEPKELNGYLTKSIRCDLIRHCQDSIDIITKDILKVNKTIMEVVKNDDHLRQLYQWITSVIGVGNVLAIELLIVTNEFKRFNSPKKFACYCGIAPFRYTSGTSLQSKARVSKHANQRVKRLLHLAALSAIRYDGDYKRYFDRRVQLGLSKMSVLNAVRNMIVRRVFACVRERRMYKEARAI